MLENDPKSRIYPIIRKEQILVKKSQLLIGQIKKSNILKVSQGPNIVKKMRLFGWLSNIITIYVIYLE